jgi:hypothetical protein
MRARAVCADEDLNRPGDRFECNEWSEARERRRRGRAGGAAEVKTHFAMSDGAAPGGFLVNVRGIDRRCETERQRHDRDPEAAHPVEAPSLACSRHGCRLVPRGAGAQPVGRVTVSGFRRSLTTSAALFRAVARTRHTEFLAQRDVQALPLAAQLRNDGLQHVRTARQEGLVFKGLHNRPNVKHLHSRSAERVVLGNEEYA